VGEAVAHQLRQWLLPIEMGPPGEIPEPLNHHQLATYRHAFREYSLMGARRHEEAEKTEGWTADAEIRRRHRGRVAAGDADDGDSRGSRVKLKRVGEPLQMDFDHGPLELGDALLELGIEP
jgi:hypothetical protein